MKGALERDTLAPEPTEQLNLWLEQAVEAQVPEPNAMVLSTVDAEGQPWQRTVLLKGIENKRLLFFTNLESNKARHIEANDRVSLLFLWLPLERQVIVTGRAELLTRRRVLQYFASRPFGSKLGAWASKQSSVITSRKLLEMKWDEMKRKFAKGEVPLPSFWGGYAIAPDTVEFWQGRPSRLHDRFLYRAQPDATWTTERLSP